MGKPRHKKSLLEHNFLHIDCFSALTARHPLSKFFDFPCFRNRYFSREWTHRQRLPYLPSLTTVCRTFLLLVGPQNAKHREEMHRNPKNPIFFKGFMVVVCLTR